MLLKRLRLWWRHFGRLRQLHSMGWLVLAQGFSLLLSLVTGVIIFRQLGPTDIGRVTLAFSVMGLFSLLAEFGLRDAAVNYISREKRRQGGRLVALVGSFFSAKLLLAGGAAVLGLSLAAHIAHQVYPGLQMGILFQLAAVGLFSNGLLGFSLAVLEGEQRFAAVSLVQVFQSLLRAVLVLLCFGLNILTAPMLLSLEVLTPAVAFLYSWRLLPPPRLAAPTRLELRRLFKFSRWIAVSAVAQTLLLRLDMLLLSHFHNATTLGLYAAAASLVNRLNILRAAALTSALPEASRRLSAAELRAFVRESLQITGLISLLLLPLFGLGGPLLRWLYGSNYEAAMPVFNLLLAAFLVGFNLQPLNYVFYALNRLAWLAGRDVAQVIALILLGAGWVLFLVQAAGMALNLLLVRHCLWAPSSFQSDLFEHE